MKTVDEYLATLRRIPNDIVLSMATREIEPEASQSCICGWAMRESLAHASNLDAEQCGTSWFSDVSCARRFGGTYEEWYDVYNDIAQMDCTPVVEEAFARRVMEAAGVRP